MFIKNLDSHKSSLANRSFDGNKSSEVELTGTKFKIYEPNFNGGTIVSNCNHLNDEDFAIISEMKSNKLNDIEKELDYLKVLIQKRKAELLEPKVVTKLNTVKYKDGNKKMVSIYVEQYTVLSDVYGDEKIINTKTLEDYKISDTNAFQKEIELMIEKLKKKYNI